MLRHEDRMAAERSLLSIVHGSRRRQPPRYEVARMLDHDRQSTVMEICALARSQPEPPTECRACKG
jgi:hypothetical protein